MSSNSYCQMLNPLVLGNRDEMIHEHMLEQATIEEENFNPRYFNLEKFPLSVLPREERPPYVFDLDTPPNEVSDNSDMDIEHPYILQDSENSDQTSEVEKSEQLQFELAEQSVQEELQDFESAEAETISDTQSYVSGKSRGSEIKSPPQRNQVLQVIYEKLVRFFRDGVLSRGDLPSKKKVANLYSLEVLEKKIFSQIIIPILLECAEEAEKKEKGRAYLHKKRGDQFQKKFHSKWSDLVYYKFKIPGVTREKAEENMRHYFGMTGQEDQESFERIFGSLLRMGLENNAVETMLTNDIIFRENISASVVLTVIEDLCKQTMDDIETNFMGHITHLLSPSLSEKEREDYVEKHLNKTRTVKKPFMFLENFKAAQAFTDKLLYRVKKLPISDKAEKHEELTTILKAVKSKMQTSCLATEEAKGKGRKSKDLSSFVRLV